MNNTTNIQKIIREDILRLLGEVKEKVSLHYIKAKIKASPDLIDQAFKELEKQKMIDKSDLDRNKLSLTKKGEKESKKIIRKHIILENYFKKSIDDEEAHKKAHILEHYVAKEVIKRIEMLSTLKSNDLPLTDIDIGKAVLITDIEIKSSFLFERIVSMGILPGEKVRILNIIRDRFIIKVNNKKFALDIEIAQKIKVLNKKI